MSECRLDHIIRSEIKEDMIGRFGYPEDKDWDAPEYLVEECFSRMWDTFNEVLDEQLPYYGEE